MKAERTRMADTTYIVLELNQEGTWSTAADVDASSAAAALPPIR
jgi:hypothetical protein